jgi:hypothetical protein
LTHFFSNSAATRSLNFFFKMKKDLKNILSYLSIVLIFFITYSY